jgi:cell division protein FtsW (lipid II flippase)
MSKVLLFWLVVYVGGLLLAVIHPMYPFISYLTFYYAPPHVNWWGRYLPELRFSLIASIVMLASIALKRSSLEHLSSERNPALLWLLLFGLNALIVMAWALDRARSWYWTVAFLKLILLYILMPAAIRTPAHFDTFGAVHVAGATYWGYKAWDDPKRSAGRLEDVGGPDTQNDNQAAAHLLTVIPFAALYALTKKKMMHRALFAVGGAFIVNVFILCNSRGATVGLIAAVIAAVLLAGKGNRKKLLGVAAAGVIGFLLLADPEFIARQQTTTDPQDGSAQSRLEMWQGGIEMVKDYPLGAGGRAFHILSPRYIPDVLAKDESEERSSHNTYIQLSTEWGVQGTILWVGFMASTFLILHRVRKRSANDTWFFYRALVVQLALIGTLAAALFSNRLYGESIYWMCALAYTLHRMQSTAIEKAAADGGPEVATVETVPTAPVAALAAGGVR